MFNYFDDVRLTKLSKKQALAVIKYYGVTREESKGWGDSIEEFEQDCGDLDYYDTQKVVTWLGM